MHFACLVVALSAFFMGFCGSSAFATINGCDVKDMRALAPTFPWPLTIATVTDVAASGSTPEYCDVVGYVATNGEGAGVGSAGLEVGFPASWNGKYLFLGNGGLGSGLYLATAGVEGLQKGYAVAMTDMGHTPVPAGNSFYGNWALLSPGVPNTPALIDFYYRATHETALVGKQFVEAYFSKYNRGQGRISRSYYQGCSTGGRQGLVEAQRYPDDFDGLIAGDPVAGLAHQAPSNTVAEFAFLRPADAWIPPNLLSVIDAALYAKCDPKNVGVIQNPMACSFDPETLLCTNNGSNAESCLTQDQIDGLKRYGGPLLDEFGNVVMPGYPITDLGAPGAGIGVMTLGFYPPPNPTAVEPWILPPPAPPTASFTPIHWGASDGTFPYFVFLTESYNQQDFPIAFFHDRGVVAEWALVLNDMRTNLGDATYPALMNQFVSGDKKMILYHGLSDPLISPYQTVQLYKDIATITPGGYPRLQENVRLFMVPGMFHCGGGPGPNNFDALTALEEWVEGGRAPDGIVATKYTNDVPTLPVLRTMPLCKFPEVATYKGSGDVSEEENWKCDPDNQDLLLQMGYDGKLAGFPFSYLSR
jgi:feruloyl esterase